MMMIRKKLLDLMVDIAIEPGPRVAKTLPRAKITEHMMEVDARPPWTSPCYTPRVSPSIMGAPAVLGNMA